MFIPHLLYENKIQNILSEIYNHVKHELSLINILIKNQNILLSESLHFLEGKEIFSRKLLELYK